MTWVFAIPVICFLAFLLVGSITGHVQLRSCCGIADPRCDARMRDAFRDEAESTESPQPPGGAGVG